MLLAENGKTSTSNKHKVRSKTKNFKGSE